MDAPLTDVREQASPGRWVGGMVGALVCLSLFVIGQVLATLTGDGTSVRLTGTGWADTLQGLGLAGLPIAILGGRALLPDARSGGWIAALGHGLRFGLLAPPLGAIEIVAGSMLAGRGSFYNLAMLPIGLFYSYIVVFVTVPCGLAWALMVRAIPASTLRRLELPRPLARLGARHAVLLAVLAWIAAIARPYLA